MKQKKLFRRSHYLILTLGLFVIACEKTYQPEPETLGLSGSWQQQGIRLSYGPAGVVVSGPDNTFTLRPVVTIGKWQSSDNRGSFSFALNTSTECRDLHITDRQDAAFPTSNRQLSEPGIKLTGSIRCEADNSEPAGEFSFLFLLRVQGNRFKLSLFSPGASSVGLKINLNSEAALRGLGIQPSAIDLRGSRFDMLAQEGGVGRGVQPLTALTNLVSPGSAGHVGSSYYPLPVFWAQLPGMEKVWSLGLSGSQPASFDFTRSGNIEIQQVGNKLNAWSESAESPVALLARTSEAFGHQPRMPDWMHQGSVIGVQGGTARVREIWARLKAEGVPISAFWLQDWVGRRKTAIGSQLWWNWELDREHYPDWEQLRKDLAVDGIKLLGYINPFLVDVEGRKHRHNLYREALKKDFLVKDDRGEPVAVKNTDFAAGMVDLTNPEARNWLISVIRNQMINEAGFSGWMADYAEALPLDAIMHDGSSGWEAHNRYPTLWAQLQKEASTSPEQVWFPRAGHLGTAMHAPLFWLGDQTVDWSREDGLHSALIGQLSGGLSGLTNLHSDAGGYTSVSQLGITRSRELLARWVEMQAFMGVLRTHEGNQPEANAQVYDPVSLPHFARMAKIHALLFDVRKRLLQEATDTGLPLVRHPLLKYPLDTNIQALDDQFMLGDMMCAPVLTSGAVTRKVYLPAGKWVHLWSGQVYELQTGAQIETAAPLGQMPVFYPQGDTEAESLRQKLMAQGLTQGLTDANQ